MRGKGDEWLKEGKAERITPAYAGKSSGRHREHRPDEDHPRVCGEKQVPHAEIRRARGSPPRMRGKVRSWIMRIWTTRITPAYAGKRYCDCLPEFVDGDHPRVCGEKFPRLHCPVCRLGSPPRMRGKDACKDGSEPIIRITPAYAGKSRCHTQKSEEHGDHPRVCGEKHVNHDTVSSQVGSPPRMRGKEVVMVLVYRQQGITPAYAGKRLKRSHRIGHFSCILCLFHSVLHRASASGGSRAGPCAPPCLPAQNAVPV